MRTQEELRADIDRLLACDRIEEAAALGELLVPVSADELRRRLDEAPLDDEPLTPEQRRRLDSLKDALRERRGGGRRAG